MGSFNQNSLQSNIDQASKILNSVYVSNFPDGCTAKELWNVCNGYGTVVDVFIPAKKSKIGKMFAFVRFIKVHNLNRLIENLNTIWMGRYHLFANPAQFVRPPKVNSFNPKEGSVKNTRTGYNNTNHHILKDKSKKNRRDLSSKSYVDVINNGFHQKKENYPALVLDESCMKTVDYSLALMGNVKEFSALTNLKMVLANEGFESINLKYLGGFWVLVEFKSDDSKKKFNSKMDIEGLPLIAWTKNTFNHITSKWGELLYLDEQDEGYFHSKRVCVKTKLVDIICESVKIIIQGKFYWVRAKEVTGWILDFGDDNEDSSSSYEELNNDDALDDNGNLNKDSKMEDDSDLEEALPKRLRKIGYGSYAINISPSVGNSGGILCVWDPRLFHKTNVTISDYLIIIQGLWIPSGKKTAIISIYAPQDIRDKKLLWGYLSLVISNWKGDVIVMGDFNEVRSPNEMYGSVFNSQDRFLSDHRLILMRESHHDYGPTPFRFYHYWFDLEGFDKFVEETWTNVPQDDTNAMRIKNELSKIEVLIDKGEVKWAIGGDENSKYFHGVLNKNRNQHSIRGILVDGNWIKTPSLVKKEFLSYFSNCFDRPPKFRLHNNAEFPNKLSPEQKSDLEINVTRSEIKKAVWDCGTDKSPSPDGFTFGFFRRYCSFLENDVNEAVNAFFTNGNFPKGINSSFITLIPKNQEAKTTKDFCPITLIGCIYKIITKILANRMVFILEDLVNEVQSSFISKRQILDGPFILNELYHWCSKKKKQTMIFKVDFKKAYDSVCWDYLDDILKKFKFREKWCSWILNCLISSKGSILVNGSPSIVVEAGLFRGVQVGNDTQVSHLFFVDDAVFMGHWSDSNIDTIIRGRCKPYLSEDASLSSSLFSALFLFTICLCFGFPYRFGDSSLINLAYGLKLLKEFMASTATLGERRLPRGGIEEAQYNLLTDFVQGVTLSEAKDCFRWSLDGKSVKAVEDVVENESHLDCFDDCVGAKGGVVSGAGVVIGVMSNLVKEKPGSTNGIGGGYPRGVDGGATWHFGD
nr:RNA-directed DNA polymerase, eukaryota [Tanacetum cinerariifolium]